MAELDPETRARREAALRRILRYGDPALRSAARPVERFDAALGEEVERMTGLLDDALGAGLAATQLGVMNRVFVYRADPDAPIGVGRRSMRERATELAGRLTVEPGLDGGTVVRLHLPVGGSDARA